jgi:hypothetical protein
VKLVITTSDSTSAGAEEKLTDAERALLVGAGTGAIAGPLGNDPDLYNLATVAKWDPRRNIRADFLASLMTGDRVPPGGQIRSIKVRGARIIGRLDLETRKLACPVLLRECYFDEPPNLDEAEAVSIRLLGCHLPGLTAERLQATGNVEMSDGFRSSGEVRMLGARIGGMLDFSGAFLENPDGRVLTADGLTVGQTMWCEPGFTARGEVMLTGARIGDQLHFGGATLENGHGPALRADGLTVGQSMYCGRGFSARGEVRLTGAHIGGQLTFRGAALENRLGAALHADLLTVDQGMLCDEGFTAQGEVRLVGAHITGQMILNGAVLESGAGNALLADGLTVTQHMHCTEGFTARGKVKLTGAHIGGELGFRGAALENRDGIALHADGLAVDQDMLCDEGFTATGEVELAGAHIGGCLSFRRATLNNEKGRALFAGRLTVEQTMYCDEGFTAYGEVLLAGAHIAGQLGLRRATLENQGGSALNADGLTVDRGMHCDSGFTAHGGVLLRNAHIGEELTFNGAILENQNDLALNASRLTVDGDVLCQGDFTARGELRLEDAHIAGQLGFAGATLLNPGGLVLDLEGAGIGTLFLPDTKPDGAIDVSGTTVEALDDVETGWPDMLFLRGFIYGSLLNQHIDSGARLRWLTLQPGRFDPQPYDQLADAYRRAGNGSWERKVLIAKERRRRRAYSPLSWLWYLTVGYGYRTWQALIWLAGLAVAGTVVYGQAYPAHMVAVAVHPPAFQPLIYALDVLVPVVGLGQKSAWQPAGTGLVWFSFGLTVAGWVLATAVAAGLSGVLKRTQ